MSLRQQVMDNRFLAMAWTDGIMGAVDDEPQDPADFVTLPRPMSGYGEPLHPFAFVFEAQGEETPLNGDTQGLTGWTLEVAVMVAYRFTPYGVDGFMREGRRMLALVQKSFMADPNAGGNAMATKELGNGIYRVADSDNVGVAQVRFEVEYQRSVQDPDSRDAISADAA